MNKAGFKEHCSTVTYCLENWNDGHNIWNGSYFQLHVNTNIVHVKVCCGLNMNIHIHACVGTFSTQLLALFWKTLGGRALLEELCHWGWALRFYSLVPLPVYSASSSAKIQEGEVSQLHTPATRELTATAFPCQTMSPDKSFFKLHLSGTLS